MDGLIPASGSWRIAVYPVRIESTDGDIIPLSYCKLQFIQLGLKDLISIYIISPIPF